MIRFDLPKYFSSKSGVLIVYRFVMDSAEKDQIVIGIKLILWVR